MKVVKGGTIHIDAPQEVVIMKGLPASGKTTEAKILVVPNRGKYMRVSKDDLRWMLEFGRYSRESEEVIQAVRDAIIETLLSLGRSVVVDDTNLNPEHIERIVELTGPRASRVVDLTDVPLETCLRRDRDREESEQVGENVIRNMAEKYLSEVEET